MNIGLHTFAEFRELAAKFHGYPAPGLLVGGYMVEMAKSFQPEGTLFEVTVETKKCLPDAVQLLTLCSTGNDWMRVVDLGRYALSMYDKNTGLGVRVYLDTAKLVLWPELQAWYLKRKPKAEQDTDLLLREIEQAGDTVLSHMPVRMRPEFLGHTHKLGVSICPSCNEAFPEEDGPLCRGCRGEAPYTVR